MRSLSQQAVGDEHMALEIHDAAASLNSLLAEAHGRGMVVFVATIEDQISGYFEPKMKVEIDVMRKYGYAQQT